ncbi:hypothetical protein GCM10012280_37790 [Wenjunlia tyrosinilytica]|uniref:HTH cro/C1-type domain-containing protein n=1 Tax=Wenjunlia tyrosinilytica TaxID=1544741 RepID=A0A918DYI9_9ACTN|nr:hypothetical protein GCM10012280_37790 [Wenjunlia tyrosinilytica]
MRDTADEHFGARIARHRVRRGLTQQGLAMRANVSKSLISKVETGGGQASPSLVAACARALAVSTSDLLGQPYMEELRRDRLDAVIHPLRASMENWDIPLGWEVPPRPVALIRDDVREVLAQRRQAEYMPMARDLPALIDECVHAVHTARGEEQRQVHECLAWVFRCVFTLAWNFGYADLGSSPSTASPGPRPEPRSRACPPCTATCARRPPCRRAGTTWACASSTRRCATWTGRSRGAGRA